MAICAICKNEAPYLGEWSEFHSLVGVQRFHLYQNRSADDYLSVLGPYLDEGVVELTEWPRLPPCQKETTKTSSPGTPARTSGLRFSTAMSFSFSSSYATVGEAVDSMAQSEWSAIGVNRMCFGASGQDEPRPDSSSSVSRCGRADSFPPNRHIKSIVRMDRALFTDNSHTPFRQLVGSSLSPASE